VTGLTGIRNVLHSAFLYTTHFMSIEHWIDIPCVCLDVMRAVSHQMMA